MRVARPNTKFNINKLNFAIPLIAFTGLGAIGVFAINQDIDETASASNSAPISTTVSYEDEYITISSSSAINIGTADVVADGDTYVYTTDNVTVSTNVSTGYDLYITSGNTESASLTNPDYYTEIAATSGTGSDTGTPKVLDANSYGYAVPNTLATNSNFDADYSNPTTASKWAGVPVGHQDRLRSTHVANESGDVTDIHYGAYVTNYLAEGTYTNEVVYSAVATPTHETVDMEVSPNIVKTTAAGTTVTIISGPTSISTTHELNASEVEVHFRQNNIDKGACSVTKVDPSAGHLVTTCTAPALSYGAYDVVIIIPRYGFTDIVPSGYSIKTLKMLTSEANITTLQNLTSSVCSDAVPWASSDEDFTLLDPRDNNAYSIRKLADGNCWMTQNLRLVNKNLTADNSDISDSFTIPASSTSTGSTNGNWGTDRNASSVDHTAVYYDNVSYGAYYNWYTATAGSGTYSFTGAAKYSICPKGWNLPSSSGGRSWTNLFSSYATNVNRFQLATNTGADYQAGYFNSGSVVDAGSRGFWWSKQAYYSNGYYDWAYSLLINDKTVTTSYANYADNYKYQGHTIRCVFVGS